MAQDDSSPGFWRSRPFYVRLNAGGLLVFALAALVAGGILELGGQPGTIVPSAGLAVPTVVIALLDASDMKGFLAIATNAAARLNPNELVHPLVFIFTYDEELGTIGAKHFADTWPDAAMMPKSTIIGEPTSLHAIRMHKGHMAIRLVVEGAPAHSGYPHLGRSAIEPVGRMIVALTDLRTQLANERPPNREHFSEVPFVPLNIAQVSGGSAINVVPDLCELNIGFRLLPGMESGPLLERIRETLRDALGETEYNLEVRYESPPMLLREDAHGASGYYVDHLFTGKIVAGRQSGLGFVRTGTVVEVLVDEGARVYQGQVIARLDREQLLIKRGELLAKLDQASNPG